MRAWLTIGLLLCSLPALAEVYRWVDDDGAVHFSDRPHPGAVRVGLSELTGVPGGEAPRSAAQAAPASTAGDAQAAPGDRYRSLQVKHPDEEQVLWNLGGVLEVALELDPPLRPGHRLRVYYDGELLEDLPAGALRFQIPDVYRGEHTLSARVEDARGRTLIESPTVTFYVQQSSLFYPRR